MPTYEYEREDGTRFEIKQKITDDPLEVCPETGQKVKRLLSAPAFHLKGTGWYKTDYAGSSSSSSSPTTSSSSSSSSTTEKSSTSSSDSSSSTASSSDD
ncbi:MAG: hypothetical protein KDD66_02190 [Bdellovibrionales bacterium]|nr:hypothetical protein [Bdellovibrionales bacterium]